MIVCFLSITTLPPSAILLRGVYLCFDKDLMVLFCGAIRKDSVFLSRFHFRRHAQIFSYEISLVCRLKYPYSCFPSNFFFGYFCSVGSCVLCIVSDHFNQSSFVFLMLSLTFCIDASILSSLLTSTLPTSFLFTVSLHYFWEVSLYASLFVFLFSGSFVVLLSSPSRMVPSILQRGQPRGLSV